MRISRSLRISNEYIDLALQISYITQIQYATYGGKK